MHAQQIHYYPLEREGVVWCKVELQLKVTVIILGTVRRKNLKKIPQTCIDHEQAAALLVGSWELALWI